MARPYLPFAGRRLDCNATGIDVGLFNVATAEATWPEPDFHLSPSTRPPLCEEFYKLQNARLNEIFVFCVYWMLGRERFALPWAELLAIFIGWYLCGT